MGCGCNKNKKPAANQSYSAKINSRLGFDSVPNSKDFPATPIKTEEKVEPKSPSLFAKALNLGEALANHVADGMSKVTKEQMADRLSVCQRCPFISGGNCTKCGCILSVKAGWKTSECPDNRWPILIEK